MAVSAQKLASQVGARILAQGGNAADAAVAMGYALAVVYPAAGNIGGGGFMLLREPGKQAVFIDFREKAPAAARADMYLDAGGKVIDGKSLYTHYAVGVPGTVAGMEHALKKWGTMPLSRVMAPAIALARDGFVLEEGDVALLNTSTDAFRADPFARAIFLRPDGSPLQVGDRLVQKDLARSLEQVEQHGPDAFYKGPIMQAIVAESNKNGGLLQASDFAHYAPRELTPLRCQYRGFQVETAPPPSGGGIAL